MAAVLELYAPPLPVPPPGIHQRAVVDASAVIEDGTAIGALSFVGAGVRIGAGTIIHPNVTILDDAVIGSGCVLWPGVVIRERCEIGDGCILHSNVTIGADGFGYRPAADGRSLVKIPHIGTVRIGRDVEIGAGTCVDRGKFSATTIGDGTKIDNLCQIAHNCRIGRGVIIVSKCGFGGSCTVGDGAMFGGGSILKDHVTVGPGARLGGCSAAMNDIPAGESWHGHPAHNATATFREFAAIRKLPEMLRTIKRLEKQQAKAAD
jgi:UDP-3-O-[3-hydroxymyristoyl] glucosamine N-acyltransferase